MSIFEYDEEKHLKNEREFGYQRGHKAGMKKGREAGIREGMAAGHTAGMREGLQTGESRVNALILKLTEAGRESEIIKAATDKTYQEKLFKEFDL